jgi:hypothetical protein
MSALEFVFWHVLGYASIPVILGIGILISSLIYFVVFERMGRGEND